MSGRLGRLPVIVLIPLIVVGAFGFAEAVKLITAPWAVAWLPGPKLAGTWAGPLRARQGAEYRVFVDLRYADERRASRTSNNNLGGTGRVCTRDGTAYDYIVYGGASWSGRDVEIRLTYGDPRLSALAITLRGTWPGDSLALTPTDNPFDPDGVFRLETPSSSTDPDDSFAPTELRRASPVDFELACRRLAEGR